MPPVGPLHVLLIEDSDDDAQLIARNLRCAGWELDARVISSRSALEECLKQPWDIILSDCRPRARRCRWCVPWTRTPPS